MRLPKLMMPLIALVILGGSVAVAWAAGWWITGVDVTKMSSPQEIRGWMSFEQVSGQFGIPVEVLYQQLDIPAAVAPTTPIRDIEKQMDGFEVTAVQQVVADYLKDHKTNPSTAP